MGHNRHHQPRPLTSCESCNLGDMASRIFVVLGMHKSGTTLISEMLHRSGIPMVETVLSGDYDSGNKWERGSTLELNKGLLGCHDQHSLDLPRTLPDGLSKDPASDRVRALVESIDEPLWGFKDPRTCITWPAWSAVLKKPRIVGVHRKLSAVVEHYSRRRGRFISRARAVWKAARAWSDYNEEVLRACASAPGLSVLISFDDLMTGEGELRRLESFLEVPLADARKKEHFHNRGGMGPWYWLITVFAFPLRPGRPQAIQRQLSLAGASHSRRGPSS